MGPARWGRDEMRWYEQGGQCAVVNDNQDPGPTKQVSWTGNEVTSVGFGTRGIGINAVQFENTVAVEGANQWLSLPRGLLLYQRLRNVPTPRTGNLGTDLDEKRVGKT